MSPVHEDPVARLHVERRGSGPPVVLVHGFTQNGASLAPLAALLSDGHEVLLPDLPGHGDSPLPTGDIWSAAEQLGESCGRATYVGYSLGGRICLHLALSSPERVEKLVLVSTTAGIEDADERAEREKADEALAERLETGGDAGLSHFLDEWLAGPLFAHLDDETAGKASRLNNTAAGLAASLRHDGTGRQQPLWERLGELTMPVVVIAGEEDSAYAQAAQRLASAIGANALFLLVPETGHSVLLERPEAVARLVADFVAGEGPATREGPEDAAASS